ncbi:MAG: hypothetical protein ACAI43_11195 [Phycisphaerae bacterium]|nr:hypothetical protein [Tepidisphaeraceae bacterium]
MTKRTWVARRAREDPVRSSFGHRGSKWVEALEPRRLCAADYAVNVLDPGLAKDLNDAGAVLGTWDQNTSFAIGVWSVGRRGRVSFAPLTGFPSNAAVGRGNLADIDESGLIAGTKDVSPASAHATVWAFERGTGYVPFDLGTLPGDLNSAAEGMDDAGLVVGGSGQVGPGQRAFIAGIRRGGATFIVDLNTFAAGTGFTLVAGRDLNNGGSIIGTGGPGGTGEFLMVPRRRGAYRFYDVGGLDAANPDTDLERLNEANAAVGGSVSPVNGTEHAVVVRLDALTGLPVVRDLGYLPGGSSFANDIADNGVIVGRSVNSGGTSFGYLWSPRRGGRYTAVNLNDVVDLPAGWRVVDGRGVNENGQIAADVVDGSGQTFLALLTPTVNAQVAVFVASPLLTWPATGEVEGPVSVLSSGEEDRVWEG